ncbi:hypothetical protein SAMN06297387_110179 [Streptomyces zhaozhouensis]|jgi:hypothetical protein|uniref:Uncharacterized protein n=1 Tax=Streptomyces zhaozhouensis TaxID=1300267 RepID=A0A286DXP3_9ACTN|nr:hypothetical protein [Streptomyces zhaozhouensis]SOD63447.1 hypothetical protein SAMN06297387_110179 [Streptomyces zhaozhouensis]
MTRYGNIPQPVRSAIVIVDPERGTPRRVIVLQFNPETLERSLAPQAAGEGGEGEGDRNEALRLKGPAEETWTFTAEIDSTDQLEVPTPDGIHPQLAALEMLVHPTTAQLRAAIRESRKGTIEITPIEMPLTLFSWGSKRVLPVRLTELGISESHFDVNLNPMRASLNIGLKVLSVSDLPVEHRGSELYLAHLAQKERLAGLAVRGGGVGHVR